MVLALRALTTLEKSSVVVTRAFGLHLGIRAKGDEGLVFFGPLATTTYGGRLY